MNISQFRNKFNSENTTRSNLASVAASQAVSSHLIPVNSAGEAMESVRFPVKFLDMPMFTFGLQLQEGEGVIPGRRPSGSAYVESWITEERLPHTIFYVGAVIVGILEGPSFQKIIMNASFTGLALTNPS